ncbi:hypothetical protein [Rhodococcus sovatensis]|uniref:TAP-like protein n=1 Tax=Rhodococcus sovatensis TaxID=1805840 RepID=A0ABZ2PKH7_9NOCA
MSEQDGRKMFETLVTESGRAYWEMGLPWLDRSRAARVHFDRITTPVLAISGNRDRIVAPRVARVTASKYSRGTFVSIPGADHMVFDGDALPATTVEIDKWLTDSSGADSPLAPVADSSPFVSALFVTRTDRKLSVVCTGSEVPDGSTGD